MFKNKQSTILLFTILTSISLNILGQTPRQYIGNHMLWTGIALNGKIKGKFSYQFDYHYRRQAIANNLASNNSEKYNVFGNAFQQLYRPWIHYNFSPQVRFSLVPIALWSTWTMNTKTKKADKYLPEFRISPFIHINSNIGKLTLMHRLGYEFRFLGKSVASDDMSDGFTGFTQTANRRGRIRYMIRANYPLNNDKIIENTLYLNSFNEIFFGTGKNVVNTLDQNRTSLGIGYKFKNEIRLEAGYFYQLKFGTYDSVNKVTKIEEINNFQLFLIFDDINSYFKKKE